MKTYKKNKNMWQYRFSTELVNGGVYDCLVISTQYGFEFASYSYSKSLREQGKEWRTITYLGKEKVKWYFYYLN